MKALDLFAGTGWGVACQRLGIHEQGVEIMPEAIASRDAAGMETIYHDVWDGLESTAPMDYDLGIASPPCQTFSAAGAGAGRKALDVVLRLIDEGAYHRLADLRAFGESHDPRTALVLTPLAYAMRDTPRAIVWEQVPPVLPVWEAAAVKLREVGYSVVTGIVNAEQYGVPQTRRRAILVARWDGEAKLPTPTHSRYYSRDPKRLDDGVKPWVSMAEALGWEVAPGEATVRTSMGTPKVDDRNGSHELDPAARPAHTITSKSNSVTLRSNYGTGGDPEKRGERAANEPAATITSKADRSKWVYAGAGATAEKTAGQIPRELDEPAHTVTGKGTATFRTRDDSDRVRLTAEEAAVLQSYPADFPFQGTKTKRFLQIGNAVPPLLAEAILREVTS